MRALGTRYMGKDLQALGQAFEQPRAPQLPPGFTSTTDPDGTTHYFYRGEPSSEEAVKAASVTGLPVSASDAIPALGRPSYGVPPTRLTQEVQRYVAEMNDQRVRPKMSGVFESENGSRTRAKMREVRRRATEKYGQVGPLGSDDDLDWTEGLD